MVIKMNYDLLLEKSREYYNSNMKEYNTNMPDDFVIMQLFDLMSNLLNQVEYDYIYTFKEHDFDFIIKYNINIPNALDYFYK